MTLLSGPPARILEQDADGVRVAQGDTELRCRVVVQSDGAGGGTCAATTASTPC